MVYFTKMFYQVWPQSLFLPNLMIGEQKGGGEGEKPPVSFRHLYNLSKVSMERGNSKYISVIKIYIQNPIRQLQIAGAKI